MLWLAEISPTLAIKDVTMTPVDRTDVVKVTVVVENEGYLPTNITQRALDAELAVPVRATVELTDAELVSGARHTDLGHLKGSRDTQGQAGTAKTHRTLEYIVRATGPSPVLSLLVRSEKGGVARREIQLAQH